MNKYTFLKEIANLRVAVADIREAETGLSDAQNNTRDSIECAEFERDITLLRLAAELVERTLPPQ